MADGSMVGKVLLGRYEIVELLGEGGMGSVYKARHVDLKRAVALKIVSDRVVCDDTARARFRREAEASSQFHHTGLCPVHDFGFTEDGLPFFVMDLIDGQSLAAMIKENGKLSAFQVTSIARQICSALAHAHKHNVVHRDLKPSNVMIVQGDEGIQVKVVDFGIAKALQKEGQNLTTTGEVFGTPFYMSPEQCQGKAVDARADLYSLGCLMYEALSGRPPFQAETPLATVIKHVEEQAPNLVAVPEPLASVVAKLMQKDPAARFQSADEVRAALAAAPDIVSFKRPYIGKALTTAFTVFLLAAAAAFAFHLYASQQANEFIASGQAFLLQSSHTADDKQRHTLAQASAREYLDALTRIEQDPIQMDSLSKLRTIRQQTYLYDLVSGQLYAVWKALYAREKAVDPTSIDCGRALAMIGRIHHLTGDHEHAPGEYDQAASILMQAGAPAEEAGIVRHWAANICSDMRIYPNSIANYEAALECYDSVRAPTQHLAATRRIAEAQYAVALQHAGRFDEAISHFEHVFKAGGVDVPQWHESYQQAKQQRTD